MDELLGHAADCIARCRRLGLHTEEPGFITRTFLSEPMRGVHADITSWMQSCGMSVRVDAAGNLRGRSGEGDRTLFIGSHLDTVPHAGAFDGILGVVIGVKLVELTRGRRLPFTVEVAGFSEEEGVRFGFPFIGSLALVGELDAALTKRPEVLRAIADFGLDPTLLPEAKATDSLGYLEFHIEQGPALESRGSSLGIVDAIAGQTRMEFMFEGRAGHAGTTPMHLRKDALAGASEWILSVEREARSVPNLVATVGRAEVLPGAPNVIAGLVHLSLDVRHGEDSIRRAAVARIMSAAESVASVRNLKVTSELRLDQAAVAMDAQLTESLVRAVASKGHTVHKMLSGAGHDAMVVSRRMPVAMLFLRSPGGLSHHPDESVLVEDVAAALAVGVQFLDSFEALE